MKGKQGMKYIRRGGGANRKNDQAETDTGTLDI